MPRLKQDPRAKKLENIKADEIRAILQLHSPSGEVHLPRSAAERSITGIKEKCIE